MIQMELVYLLKCKKYTENKNAIFLRISNDKMMLAAHYVVCDNKKGGFLIPSPTDKA